MKLAQGDRQWGCNNLRPEVDFDQKMANTAVDETNAQNFLQN